MAGVLSGLGDDVHDHPADRAAGSGREPWGRRQRVLGIEVEQRGDELVGGRGDAFVLGQHPRQGLLRAQDEAVLVRGDDGRIRVAPVGPPLELLATVAATCRDRVRLSFAYRAADGADSERYVEPYGLVALGARHYLVAHDLDRADWRTFRLDRMTNPRPARTPFTPRPLPADDLLDYVRRSQRGIQAHHRVVIDVEIAGEALRRAYGRWVSVDDVGERRCRVTMDTDDFTWPLHILANIDAAFAVIEPAELRQRVAAVARRFSAAG